MTASDEAITRVDQIAEAALRRFARYGFKRSSMDDIAREAGLAKATLYLHFKGKDDVFRAMLALIGRSVEARCEAVMARSAPFAAKLAALLDAHYGTGYACFGSGEHLVELKSVMLSIASAEVEAFEAIFARHVTMLIDVRERGYDLAGAQRPLQNRLRRYADAGSRRRQACLGPLARHLCDTSARDRGRLRGRAGALSPIGGGCR